MRPLDSSRHRGFRRNSSCSAAETCQSRPCRLRNDEPRPFPRSAAPLPRPKSASLWPYGDTQPPCTNGDGTPNRWMRSRIATNNSRRTATSAIWNVTHFTVRGRARTPGGNTCRGIQRARRGGLHLHEDHLVNCAVSVSVGQEWGVAEGLDAAPAYLSSEAVVRIVILRALKERASTTIGLGANLNA